MDDEEWKVVPETDGFYEVSSMGRVRSLDRHVLYSNGELRFYEGRLLNPVVNRLGYKQVTIRYRGKTRTVNVHVLVLHTFVCLRPDKMQIRHLNGNRQDAALGNLKYGTAKENAEDRYLHGTNIQGSKQHASKLKEEQVLKIYKSYWTEGVKIRSLARNYGVDDATIADIITGRGWKWLTGHEKHNSN